LPSDRGDINRAAPRAGRIPYKPPAALRQRGRQRTTAAAGARARGGRRTVCQRQADGLLRLAAEEGDLDRVARLLVGDGRRDVVGLVDRVAGHADDQVAAELDPLTGLVVTRLEAGLRGRATGLHGLNEGAVVHREVPGLHDG